jgi:hypothetical protein
MRFQLTARTGHPDFLDLPWDRPLSDWAHDRLVEVARGIHRHVVRFVHYDGAIYALKELPARYAAREYRLLRALEEGSLPVVEPVGQVTNRETPSGEALEPVLITRHLEFSLPYRLLFVRGIPDARGQLIDALAGLLVRLHLVGFYWGDCSLSNALFRRDAGALAAYLVDAETGELHNALTEGQRRHDVGIAYENVAGELLDVQAAFGLGPEIDPIGTADELIERYRHLWDEIVTEDIFAEDERFRVEERLRRVNELGFDVEEVEIETIDGGFRLRLHTHVVEPGHHQRRLMGLTGLHVQENQARRLLNDVAHFKAHLEAEEGAQLPDPVVAYRWVNEVFEPAIAAIPAELRAKREPAELYHELLEHKYLRSKELGRDVGLGEAVTSYVTDVLRHQPDERSLLDADDDLVT